MRTTAQAAVWTWIILSIGWLAIVVWVAIIEPMDEAAPWVYAMTAVVPPTSLLVVGAVLTWTVRALLRCLSPYLLRLALPRT
jgi:hypothetical protein